MVKFVQTLGMDLSDSPDAFGWSGSNPDAYLDVDTNPPKDTVLESVLKALEKTRPMSEKTENQKRNRKKFVESNKKGLPRGKRLL